MSDMLGIASGMAKGLLRVGAMDETTLHDLEALCLPPTRAFDAAAVRRIRLANSMGPDVFAEALGVGGSTLRRWERGESHPRGAARRLLDVVDRKGIAVLF